MHKNNNKLFYPTPFDVLEQVVFSPLEFSVGEGEISTTTNNQDVVLLVNPPAKDASASAIGMFILFILVLLIGTCGCLWAILGFCRCVFLPVIERDSHLADAKTPVSRGGQKTRRVFVRTCLIVSSFHPRSLCGLYVSTWRLFLCSQKVCVPNRIAHKLKPNPSFFLILSFLLRFPRRKQQHINATQSNNETGSVNGRRGRRTTTSPPSWPAGRPGRCRGPRAPARPMTASTTTTTTPFARGVCWLRTEGPSPRSPSRRCLRRRRRRRWDLGVCVVCVWMGWVGGAGPVEVI